MIFASQNATNKRITLLNNSLTFSVKFNLRVHKKISLNLVLPAILLIYQNTFLFEYILVCQTSASI